MTKRMLSLLLALVMTLSLCVPALAADEFEAETVTEVVEQAPEAPVEPEAPEAEVVGEPVAEEEAVEAPEVAAALVEEEEEDLPLLVKLGVVTKEAHYDLYNAIDEAEDLLAAVQAHELRSEGIALDVSKVDIAKYAKDAAANDPFADATGDKSEKEDFATVLATAQTYLKGMDGTPVDVTVNTSNVQKYADALAAFLDEYDDYYLVDTIDDGTNVNDMDELEALIVNNCTAHAAGHVTLDAIASDLNVTSKAAWKKTYQPEYLEALQKAINAYQELDGQYEVAYADYYAATQLALAALVQEEQASKPDTDDLAKVTAAIKNAPSESEYESTRYLLSGIPGKGAYKVFETTGPLGALKALLADKTNQTVDFKTTTSLWDVNNALTNLENATKVAGDPTIKFVDDSFTQGPNGSTTVPTVDVAITNSTGTTGTYVDGYFYGIAWYKTKNNTAKTETWFNSASGAVKNAGDDPTKHAYNLVQGSANSFGVNTWDDTDEDTRVGVVRLNNPTAGGLDAGDTITVQLFYEGYNGEGTKIWIPVTDGTKTFTIGAAAISKVTNPYANLKIASTGYTYGSDTRVVSYDIEKDDLIKAGGAGTLVAPETTTGLAGEIKVHFAQSFNFDADGVDSWIEYTNSNGDVIKVAKKNAPTTALDNSDVIGSQGSDVDRLVASDAALKAGTYTVTLVYEDAKGETHTGITKTFTIDPLSKYDYADEVKDIIEAAEELDPIDYQIKASLESTAPYKGSTNAAKTAEAIALIKTDAAAVKTLISDRTAGLTLTNVNALLDGASNNIYGIGDIEKICAFLEKKPAVYTELAKVMDEAVGLVGSITKTEDDGTGTYTWNTYGKLKADMKKADKLLTSSAYQSDVNAYVEILKADIAALDKIAEIDKTGLEASVKAAEALKETDYTAASWKDVQDALAAAKKVLEKAAPTQAELTNAAAVLDAAVKALVMTDEAAAAKKALEEANEKLDAAVAKAEALKADDYTAESMKAVTDAVAAAEKLAATATAADIEAAAKAIEDAIAKLEKAPSTPVQPTIPGAPASGTGWVKATDGTWYYYKDKALQKSKWIYGKGGLWYYVGPDGDMWTGFKKIGNAWFMLQTGTEGGVQGKLLSGWINDPAIPGKDAYARTDRNSGHFGEITWTAANGDFVNGHFEKGDPAA